MVTIDDYFPDIDIPDEVRDILNKRIEENESFSGAVVDFGKMEKFNKVKEAVTHFGKMRRFPYGFSDLDPDRASIVAWIQVPGDAFFWGSQIEDFRQAVDNMDDMSFALDADAGILKISFSVKVWKN